jgi:hypothetical protein
MKRFFLFFVLSFCLTFLLTCSEDDPTGPADNPSQYAGTWEGNTSRNRPVFMRVNQQGVIDSIAVRISMSIGTGTCTAYFRSGSNININNDEFSASVSFSGVSVTLSGRFTSSNSVSGSYNGYTGSFSIACGTSLIIGSGTLFSSATWDATKN